MLRKCYLAVLLTLPLLAWGCGSGSSENPDAGDGNQCVPEQEVCNGRDDDCDDLIDEDLDTDFDNDGHYSLDSCSSPHDDCDDHDPGVYPGRSEDCDGKDNDCDGSTDEGCECTVGPPPETRECGSDVGECHKGTQTCQADGTFGPCEGSQEPVDEVCDGKDNDCDDETDNVTTPQPCDLAVGVCADATRNDCQPCDAASYGANYEIEETRCDGLDNDCDGHTDEDLAGDTHEPNDICGEGDLGNLDEAADSNDYRTEEATMYAWELGAPVADSDWFKIDLLEADHTLDCAVSGGIGAPQCFQLVLRLELPAGMDHTQWQFCVVDGMSGSCTDFGDPNYTYCTEDGDWESLSNSYRMTLQWLGACGSDDGGDMYLLVRPVAPQVISECDPYRLQMQFWYLGTDDLDNPTPGFCE